MGKIQWELLENYKQEDSDVTFEQLVEDWNDCIIPELKEEKLKKLSKEMKKARYYYFKSLYNYFELLRNCDDLLNEVYKIELPKKGPKVLMNKFEKLGDTRELPLISPHHLFHIHRFREIPKDLEEQQRH